MRILLVTQMWPGPRDPDLGAFLVPVVGELRALGHEVEVVGVTARGNGAARKHGGLLARSVRAARRGRPDVVFAHFLFPAGLAGLAAARACGAPLVVMAHGQDVANLGRRPLRAATRLVLRGASAVIANSRWLAGQIPGGASDVIDCGVDLELLQPGDADSAARALGWDAPAPRFVFAGSLIERKNVERLADAFARLGAGGLAFVGDGPLRGALEGRPGVTLAGRVEPERVADWMRAAHVVCLPSLREPFGQAALEGMALERPVVVTSVGGAAEFAGPPAGVVVDPLSVDAIEAGLREAAALPVPHPAAREQAAAHDVRVQAARMAAVLAAARERK